MKAFKFILASTLLMSSVSFFSCSDTTDNSVPVIFPEVVEKEFAPNTAGEITFTASADWRLTSSATWCSFVEGDAQTIYGSAGDQKVEFLVSNVGASFDKVDEATLTLTMNSESKVIYKITRSSKEYEMTVVDAEGNAITEENPIVIAYGAPITFTVKGNFAWAVTKMPEWVTFEGDINGSAEATVELTALLGEGFAKSAQADVIHIGSQSDPTKYAFAVAYDGIPADKIEFSVPASERERFEFSADGKSYFYQVHPDSPKDEYTAPFPIAVVARNDEYTVVCLKYNNFGYDLMPASEEWYTVTDDKQGSLSISVSENSGKERFGAIVVLPKAVDAAIGYNYHELFDKSDDNYWIIKKEYSNYVMLQMKQLAEVGGFTITADDQILPIVKLENALATYGTENVYVLSLENKSYDEIVIKPKGTSEREYVFPETYWAGVNTAWEGVETAHEWDYSDWSSLAKVWGITSNTSGVRRQMTLGLLGDSYVGYVLIEQ